MRAGLEMTWGEGRSSQEKHGTWRRAAMSSHDSWTLLRPQQRGRALSSRSILTSAAVSVRGRVVLVTKVWREWGQKKWRMCCGVNCVPKIHVETLTTSSSDVTVRVKGAFNGVVKLK